MRARLLVIIASLAGVAATGCYDPNRVSEPDEVLLLTASPDTIPANGFATSRITAKVTTATTRNLTITFTAAGGGTVSPTTAQTPDGAGEASAFLTSDSAPKTVTVTAEVKEGADVLASRSVTVTFTTATADSVLRLTTSSNQVPADGVSSVFLQAELNPGNASRTVSFKTTDGSFARDDEKKREEPSVTTGADGIARVQLFVPQTQGTALVTATSAGANGTPGFSATQTITFNQAAPDFMSLSATPLSISRLALTDVITLNAKLSRPIGKVTQETRVDFSIVSDVTGQPFGRFQNITRSNAAETASADFVPGATAPVGLATITAQVPGTNVSAQIKVDIQN